MNILNIIFIASLFMFIGFMINKKYSQYKESKNRKNYIAKLNSVFTELLINIHKTKTSFSSRMNTVVYFRSSLSEYGEVDLVYMMDKKDIAIFKETKCIYTTEAVDSSIVENIVFSINNLFKKEMNDVVEFLGLTFSKDTFEKTFNIKHEDLKEFLKMMNNNANKSANGDDVNHIKNENEKRFDLDEILDKIGKVGVNSLTMDEKIFLDNYSKNK